MKLPILWFAPVGAALIRSLGTTWRVAEQFEGNVAPQRSDRSRRVIYALWHRSLLAYSYGYRDLGHLVGVSQHRDGELGARMARRLGFQVARGSSTRGGSRLLLQMVRFARKSERDMVVVVDGPKGPPEKAKPGILFLASRLGFPIVPTMVAGRRCWRLRSWDGFLIPKPFSRVSFVFGEALAVPPDVHQEQLAELRKELDRRMAGCFEEATRRLGG